MIDKFLSKQTLFTEVRGHRYYVPEHLIQDAVREWIMRQEIFSPLPENAEWKYEWRDNDDGTVGLTCEHSKAATALSQDVIGSIGL